MAVTRTHFTFRIDMWDANGEDVVEHIAGVEDHQVARATYRAAVERWPGGAITLRQGDRKLADVTVQEIKVNTGATEDQLSKRP